MSIVHRIWMHNLDTGQQAKVKDDNVAVYMKLGWFPGRKPFADLSYQGRRRRLLTALSRGGRYSRAGLENVV